LVQLLPAPPAAMRAAAPLLILLAGSAHAQTTTPGPTTSSPLSAKGGTIGAALKALTGPLGGQTFAFTLDDETFSNGAYTYSVTAVPAPTGTTQCKAVLEKLIETVGKTQVSGTVVRAITGTCGDLAEGKVESRRATILSGTILITATLPVPSAAPTTSSPTTAAPTTAAPSTAAPTTSCPDKYGAAVCAPFLAEGLCEEDLAMAWCRASCGMCNACMFAEKKACKARDDCKWGKKKKACKAKKVKSCADLSKKKCKKADDCKWKKKACKAKNPCKLSKKKCKKSDACKWKKKSKKCKAKKAGRSASALSATSDEESSEESVSDDSSESED